MSTLAQPLIWLVFAALGYAFKSIGNMRSAAKGIILIDGKVYDLTEALNHGDDYQCSRCPKDGEGMARCWRTDCRREG